MTFLLLKRWSDGWSVYARTNSKSIELLSLRQNQSGSDMRTRGAVGFTHMEENIASSLVVKEHGLYNCAVTYLLGMQGRSHHVTMLLRTRAELTAALTSCFDCYLCILFNFLIILPVTDGSKLPQQQRSIWTSSTYVLGSLTQTSSTDLLHPAARRLLILLILFWPSSHLLPFLMSHVRIWQLSETEDGCKDSVIVGIFL